MDADDVNLNGALTALTFAPAAVDACVLYRGPEPK